ncbi:MAG: hypothetical protein U5K79_06270 [Cyclobacteriaceae bacterium]|nr:hypothetical protein [Cyclobacteriaceae bacterium]
MKKSLVIVYFAFILKPCFAQVMPVTSPQDELRKNHVKSISIFYQLPESGKDELIYQKAFNESGQCIKEYLLSLWNEVTHSRVTTYQYNQDGQIAEEVVVDQIREFFPRDREYILEFGDMPLYQKTSYAYNAAGLLTQKRIFVAPSPDFDAALLPAQMITYEWKDSLLIGEKSESPVSNAFTRIYQLNYQYDDQGRLTMKSMLHGKELSMHQTTTYRYDSLGRPGEEIIVDPSMPRNDAHFKYTYDTLGRLTAKSEFSPALGIFEEVAVYTYDNHGNAITGDRNVAFTYYDNGLIRTERWTDELTDVEILLSTTYEFYQ